MIITGITKCDEFITNCDSFFLSQSVTRFITNCLRYNIECDSPRLRNICQIQPIGCQEIVIKWNYENKCFVVVVDITRPKLDFNNFKDTRRDLVEKAAKAKLWIQS